MINFLGILRDPVATVLTVYGIETMMLGYCGKYKELMLQQYLPFTVLKPDFIVLYTPVRSLVATVLTVYGIETNNFSIILHLLLRIRCNSTYRLRY